MLATLLLLEYVEEVFDLSKELPATEVDAIGKVGTYFGGVCFL